MTEKRFTVPLKYSLSHSKIQCDGEPLTNDELVRILNTNDGAFLENFNLKKENQKLNCELSLLTIESVKTKSYEQLEKENKRLEHINEQLKSENMELIEKNQLWEQNFQGWEDCRRKLQSTIMELEDALGKFDEKNKELKKEITIKQRVIEAYDDYVQTLKEDGVLDD